MRCSELMRPSKSGPSTRALPVPSGRSQHLDTGDGGEIGRRHQTCDGNWPSGGAPNKCPVPVKLGVKKARNSPRPNRRLSNETNHTVMIGAAPEKLLPASFHWTHVVLLGVFFGLMTLLLLGGSPPAANGRVLHRSGKGQNQHDARLVPASCARNPG